MRARPRKPGGTSKHAPAAELARFPQACLRGDLASARGQEGLPEEEAMARELRHGQQSLAGATAGAARFAAGAGRHGDFGSS